MQNVNGFLFPFLFFSLPVRYSAREISMHGKSLHLVTIVSYQNRVSYHMLAFFWRFGIFCVWPCMLLSRYIVNENLSSFFSY